MHSTTLSPVEESHFDAPLRTFSVAAFQEKGVQSSWAERSGRSERTSAERKLEDLLRDA